MVSEALNPAWWGALAGLGWGLSDFLARYSGRAVGHESSAFGAMLTGSLVLGLAMVLGDFPLVLGESSWLLLGAGLGGVVGVLFLYQALSEGPVSVAVPIVSAYPVLVVAVLVASGARPTALEWLAMAAVVGGVVVVAGLRGETAVGAVSVFIRQKRTALLSLLSALGFGISLSCGQLAAPLFGELQTAWAARSLSFLFILPLFLLPGRRISIPGKWWPVVSMQGLLDGGAYVALFMGSMGAQAEIATVTSSAGGIVPVILARIVLREAVGWVHWGAIAVIFAGVAVLSGVGS